MTHFLTDPFNTQGEQHMSNDLTDLWPVRGESDARTMEERVQESQAETWRHNEEMEAVGRLRATRPEAFDRLNPSAKTAYGYYMQGKQAADAAGIDTTGKKA